MSNMAIKNGITIEEGVTPSTETGFGKVYVDTGSDLHYLDGYGNDINLVDGYNIATRSVFVDFSTGQLNYDTNPPFAVRFLDFYWYCVAFDGAYSSGAYQEFYSKPVIVPQDYSSGGLIRVYGFLDSCSGHVYLEESVTCAIRMGYNPQTPNVWNGSVTNYVTDYIPQDTLVKICEYNITSGSIQSGDIFHVRIQRRAGNANDTASSGYLGIIGCEFVYNANTPKKTY
jgi:hypothetical protein